jgi:hypothetical protein
MSETESSLPKGIDRREAIRRVTMLLGGVTLLGGSGLLTACEKAQQRAATSQAGAGVGKFTADDIALLDEVAETILPETKTPGAKATHVGAFMAVMVNDTYQDRDQRIFRDGMKQLQQASFMSVTPAQRLALLERLDKEQKTYMDARKGDDSEADGVESAPPHFFRQMKELTLLGYFTSEIGCTQAMRYRETPGRFDPCTPYTPGETAWAGHA